MSNRNIPQVTISDPVDELGKKLDQKMDKQFNLVITVFVVGFITMIMMAITLLIDSFHINSATYQEYTTKTETTNQLLQSNKDLMETNKILLETIKNSQLVGQQVTPTVSPTPTTSVFPTISN